MNIWVTSTQWPYYGGSATQAYNTIKYLRSNGNNVLGGYFNVKNSANVDPDDIGDIYKINRHSTYKDEWILKFPKTQQNTFEPLLNISNALHKNIIITQREAIIFLNDFTIKSDTIKNTKKKRESLPISFNKFMKDNNIWWETGFEWIYNRKKEYLKNGTPGRKYIGIYFNNKSDLYDKHFLKTHTSMNDIKVKGPNWKPDRIIAYNYLAPIYSKEVYPKVPVYFVVVGIPELSLGEHSAVKKNISAIKFINDGFFNNKDLLYSYNIIEKACEVSDKIIIPPNISYNLFIKLHEKYKDKIIKLDTIYPIYKNILKNKINNINIKVKKYDIICVASNWKRKVKNIDLCEKIFRKLPKLNKVIIGGYSDNSNNMTEEGCTHFNNIPNTTVLPLIKNKEVLKYLSNSKILVLPSFFESYSIILLEAHYNKCKVITSNNIGSSILLNKKYICEDVYNLNEWINKIEYALNDTNELDNHLDKKYYKILLNNITNFNLFDDKIVKQKKMQHIFKLKLNIINDKKNVIF